MCPEMVVVIPGTDVVMLCYINVLNGFAVVHSGDDVVKLRLFIVRTGNAVVMFRIIIVKVSGVVVPVKFDIVSPGNTFVRIMNGIVNLP